MDDDDGARDDTQPSVPGDPQKNEDFFDQFLHAPLEVRHLHVWVRQRPSALSLLTELGSTPIERLASPRAGAKGVALSRHGDLWWGPTQAKNAFYDTEAELRQSTFKAHARRELQRQVQLLTWLSTPQHEFSPAEQLDVDYQVRYPPQV